MNANPKRDAGFSLIEIMIALAITMIVMASVFLLLQQGQDSFRREPEVSDMNVNARSGLNRIVQNLTMAGYNTPGSLSVFWQDGNGINLDQFTIVYGDPHATVMAPTPCGAWAQNNGPTRTDESRYAWASVWKEFLPILVLAFDPDVLDDPAAAQRRRGRRWHGRWRLYFPRRGRVPDQSRHL